MALNLKTKASALRLVDLPPPPADRTGWPWTEESAPLPDRQPDGTEWPRVSVVTPSLNQGRYIEETIRSVLLQNYPNLEYIVIDGGSGDDTLRVIRKYEAYLDGFKSGPDKGHADAVNQGMAQSTGSILAFIDSDDFYLPGTFGMVARQFHHGEPVDLLYGGCLFVDHLGHECVEHYGHISTLDEILDYKHVWRQNREIVQPESFWRRSIYEKTGPFHASLPASFFYEYLSRMLISGAVFRRVDQPLACFRFQPDQRSQREKDTTHAEYLTFVEPWLWDKTVPLSDRARGTLQSEWLYNSKYLPALNDSIRRHDRSLRRWLRMAAIVARHPKVLSAKKLRWRRSDMLGKIRRTLSGRTA